jgi:hypothetical protein
MTPSVFVLGHSPVYVRAGTATDAGRAALLPSHLRTTQSSREV